MPNYEKYKCPVCNEQFSKDDDIVTCPECGTPHHRECYKLSGHCVNAGLHKTGYSFLEQEKAITDNQENIVEQAKSEYYNPPVENVEANSNNAPEENTQAKGFTPFSPIQFSNQEYKENGKIDGVEINDIAAVVRTNPKRFVSIFKGFEGKKSKLSWNWSAFFFGSFYLLFRKMYKQGVAFLCLLGTIIIGSEAAIMKFAPEYISAIQDIASSYDPSSGTMPDMSSLANIADFATAGKIIYIMLALIIIYKVILAVSADYLYKKTVFDIIKDVEEKLDNGANFTQTAIFFGQGELDQSQMKKLYLGNKGGVSIFAPFVAYFAIEIIMQLITRM